ncbi:hypothetical protein BCR41DRAFT_399344 [Lobosporangium transversale]|uniref:Uncharacterized protein n=1 Tax=Lobosporangium transversale TaxID=64571 RepID=A0A1Y2GF96_9FUNG|nr:hypothetical protein BCR41DRAFT_399344 [Lobosporangium transversale]ORZ08269.1 hypothetical protein BCR41DRAFT_399344 [Lobosporangium transversale]|eukprot:XP_021878352.1 hypothetical protein BCR41DRAFT_399344 [Lobosporangium transversale]
MLPECLSTPYTHIRVLRNHRDQMVCTTGFVKRDGEFGYFAAVEGGFPEILESVHSLKSTSTEAQKYLEQWLKSTSNNGSKDLVTFFNGEALVFRPLKTGDYVDGTQVVCPRCQKTVPRKKAKNHCRRCEEITGEFQESIVDEDNDGAHQTDAIVGSQRPHSDIEDTTDIWTSLCGSVPTNMLQSTLVNMNASVYHINGRAMILTQKHRSSCDPSSQSPTRS